MARRELKLVVIALMLFFAIAFAMMGLGLHRLLFKPMPVMNVGQIIHIDKFSSASAFVHTLKVNQLIDSESLFLFLIRIQGLSEQLKAGFYVVKPGESAQQFLQRVVDGDVLTMAFPIIEGTTQKQIAKHLAQSPYLTYQAVDWESIRGDFPSAEGLLLADTYRYEAGTNSLELLMQARNNLQLYLQEKWQQRSSGLPYKTPYEMLIAASILEKESASFSEKKLISGVIVNRLYKNMPLQMDPTVIYGLGDRYDGRLTRQGLRFDSPYNTYRYRGLPPTPIAMVGKDAIDAAARPSKTDYLYFVAKGDGTHHFSETYEEQRKAVAQYQR